MADAVKLNFRFWLPTTLPSTAAGATCTALPPTPPNSLSKAVGAREVAWQGLSTTEELLLDWGDRLEIYLDSNTWSIIVCLVAGKSICSSGS
jgi:hypothetical protein